jgi:hypothetical protein
VHSPLQGGGAAEVTDKASCAFIEWLVGFSVTMDACTQQQSWWNVGLCEACRACAELPLIWGVFVTREHVRHNKSGITHRGKTRISH